MKIQTTAVLADVYHSDKSGKNYYTFVDTMTGGQFSLGLDGQMEGVKPGEVLKVDITVKPRILRGGGMSFEYQAGLFEKPGVAPKSPA